MAAMFLSLRVCRAFCHVTLALVALAIACHDPVADAQAPKRKFAKEKSAPQGPAVREPLEAPGPIRFDARWLSALKWRSIGPATMGGRIVDLAAVESDPATYYVATASGGVFKTINGGTTFTPMFDREGAASIGDVCVTPSNPSVVWVGTGEHNARNSVSWGDGVYKSVDGGRSWQNMGLRRSFQIGRIAIHPQDPNVVYVGALGRLWGPSEERGVFKTSDGGRTWQKVLYVDDKTGCIDIALHPAEPDTLVAAMYERQRDGFDSNDPAKRWGPGSGLYKTTDGGKQWTRLTRGLPTVKMGRIGLAWYRKDPKLVYAIIETEKIGAGPAVVAYLGITGSPQGSNAPPVLREVLADGPAAKAGLKTGDRVTRIGEREIKSYGDLLREIRRSQPGQKAKVAVQRDGAAHAFEVTFDQRPNPEGKNLTYAAVLGGQQADAQEFQGADGFQTGGVFRSDDGGESWTRINSLNPRPFYYSQIHVDPSDNRHLFVLGIQLFHSADGGQTFRADAGRGVHPDHHAMWIDPRDGRHIVLGGDGGLYVTRDRATTWDFVNSLPIGQFYHVAADSRPLYRVYGGLQDNGSWGGPSRRRGRDGVSSRDWYKIGGADGFVCAVDRDDPDWVYYEAQWGGMARVNVRTGERAGIEPRRQQGTEYRFHWKTPFILSHHNPRIFYCGGNYVFRSLNRGDDLRRISPQVSRTARGSATALAESPLDPGVLYVGSDDGALWATRDGGHEWTDVTKNVGLPGPRHVATIEASRYVAGRAYVAFDGHRSDDDAPHPYVTEDYGKTWRPLRGNLPDGSTRCLREDVVNPDLLYLGTEFGLWISLDRGAEWARLNNNLPTVAVHEIAVHPTAGEIVAGTHGRSIWVLDVTALRQLTLDTRTDAAHLFQPAVGTHWAGALRDAWYGDRQHYAENPPTGATLYYYLSEPAGNVKLAIADRKGTVLHEAEGPKTPGLHALVWNLRRTTQPPKAPPGTAKQPAVLPPGAAAPSGIYQVTLSVDGRPLTRELKVEADPEFPEALLTEELEEREEKPKPQDAY
jgi:photosystem II stability/assembly factor-like uncharacterized protein